MKRDFLKKMLVALTCTKRTAKVTWVAAKWLLNKTYDFKEL